MKPFLEGVFLQCVIWLTVKSRIQFKILLLTYEILNNQALSCLKDRIVPCSNRALPPQGAGYLRGKGCYKSGIGNMFYLSGLSSVELVSLFVSVLSRGLEVYLLI